MKVLMSTRLGLITPVISRWPEALALLMSPANACTSLRKLSELIDEIWHQAGDRSVDVR